MRPPRKGSNYYNEVLKVGCGGYWNDTPDNCDFNCVYNYDWGCDECPINTQDDEPNEIKAAGDNYD